MAEHLVAMLSEMPDPSTKVVEIDGREIGIIRLHGNVYAYSNYCLHQGGPVCEGTILGKVELVMNPDQTVAGERFSDEEVHVVCPWHGYEYDIRTGECAPDRQLKLKAYPVSVREDRVYLQVEQEVAHGH